MVQLEPMKTLFALSEVARFRQLWERNVAVPIPRKLLHPWQVISGAPNVERLSAVCRRNMGYTDYDERGG